MLIALFISVAIGILLRYLQIPILRRRIYASECDPWLILVEVGFTVGLIVTFIAPIGFLFPHGRVIWIAASLAGLSLIAITGIVAVCIATAVRIASKPPF